MQNKLKYILDSENLNDDVVWATDKALFYHLFHDF